MVRIDLEAPADTGFQVFYLPAGVSSYGDHVINRFLRRGENTVYFGLKDSQLAGGRVRVDPGMSAGDYFITNLEVRAVPPESLFRPLNSQVVKPRRGRILNPRVVSLPGGKHLERGFTPVNQQSIS